MTNKNNKKIIIITVIVAVVCIAAIAVTALIILPKGDNANSAATQSTSAETVQETKNKFDISLDHNESDVVAETQKVDLDTDKTETSAQSKSRKIKITSIDDSDILKIVDAKVETEDVSLDIVKFNENTNKGVATGTIDAFSINGTYKYDDPSIDLEKDFTGHGGSLLNEKGEAIGAFYKNGNPVTIEEYEKIIEENDNTDDYSNLFTFYSDTNPNIFEFKAPLYIASGKYTYRIEQYINDVLYEAEIHFTIE